MRAGYVLWGRLRFMHISVTARLTLNMHTEKTKWKMKKGILCVFSVFMDYLNRYIPHSILLQAINTFYAFFLRDDIKCSSKIATLNYPARSAVGVQWAFSAPTVGQCTCTACHLLWVYEKFTGSSGGGLRKLLWPERPLALRAHCTSSWVGKKFQFLKISTHPPPLR